MIRFFAASIFFFSLCSEAYPSEQLWLYHSQTSRARTKCYSSSLTHVKVTTEVVDYGQLGGRENSRPNEVRTYFNTSPSPYGEVQAQVIGYNVDEGQTFGSMHTFIKHNYHFVASSWYQVSFTSQLYAPGTLKQAPYKELRPTFEIPLYFNFSKMMMTGISIKTERPSMTAENRKYMFNWYYNMGITPLLSANLGFYGEKLHDQKNFNYTKFNAGFRYQLKPNLGLRFGTYVEVLPGSLTLNHTVGTSLNF